MRKFINALPCYSFVLEQDPLTYHPFIDDNEVVDELEKVIFAPDPETGLPHSQIPVNLSESSNPQIREYINKYMQSNNSDCFTVTDVKEAFASMGNPWAQYGSEVDDEVQRLKNVVSQTIKEKNQTNN